MRIIIAGGGKFGVKLADILSKEKHDIVVIEKEQQAASELGEKLDALVLHGDAGDRKILKDADIEHADAIFTMTGDDKTNLMICELAKSFNVPKIISRVNDSENDPIFIKLGITAAINTTTSAIITFKRALEKPEHLISLVAGEKAQVLEMVVSENAKIIDKKVSEIKDFIIAAIYRDGELVKPNPNKNIRDGDILTVCISIDDVRKLSKWF